LGHEQRTAYGTESEAIGLGQIENVIGRAHRTGAGHVLFKKQAIGMSIDLFIIGYAAVRCKFGQLRKSAIIVMRLVGSR
jgi:hypothetical protein